MLKVEDWAEIRRLHRAEGMAIRAIGRRLGISRNTVKKAVASHEPPRYVRASTGSMVDAVEPQIRVLLAEFPDMPTSVIMDGWSGRAGRRCSSNGSRSCGRCSGHLIRHHGPTTSRGNWPSVICGSPQPMCRWAGQAGRPPVLVMVSGYSRVITAVMIPSRTAPDLLAGHWRLIRGWGRVPKALVWDNEGAVGSWRGGRPQLTGAMNAFRGTLGIRVIQCRPVDPEAKGLVERANGYLETSFLPGRSFASPADFNTQLAAWLVRANQRHHRRLGCRPAERWEADRAAMLALPPVAPVTGWRQATRLPRDHYVRLDANDYSVHPSAVGRRVEIIAGLEDVTVTCGGTLVARHTRCWAAHQTITDPAHAAAAAQLRRAHRLAAVPAIATSVEQRSLADYDRLFGLADEAGVAI